MKMNKCNLPTALFELTASICMVFAVALQTVILSRVLYGIAAISFLIVGRCRYLPKQTPMEAYNIKSNKWNLITALLDLMTSICMVFAMLQDKMPSKVLYGFAAIGFLISGIGFFRAYIKNRKSNDK